MNSLAKLTSRSQLRNKSPLREGYNNWNRYYFDLGEVAAGTVKTRIIKIENNGNEVQTYEVKRDPYTNPLDHTFDFNEYRIEIGPGQLGELKILYNPNVPDAVNFDYFNITDSSNVSRQIIVKGKSKGPRIISDENVCTFVCKQPNAEVLKDILLVNASKVPATYQFDLMSSGTFECYPASGIIQAADSVHIVIKFRPRKPRIYFKELTCLILHQAPVIIQLVGLCTKDAVAKGQRTIIQHPMCIYCEGYEGYLMDYAQYVEDIPPVSVSMQNLDFGRCGIGGTREVKSVSITNNTDSVILVEWYEDAEKVFEINPPVVDIFPKQSAIFEVRFNPTIVDLLYAAELEGCAFWWRAEVPRTKACQSRNEVNMFRNESTREEFIQQNIVSLAEAADEESIGEVKVPIPFTLKVIGSTFQPECHPWIPNYRLSSINIVLPACMPRSPQYTSFLIEHFGHLPLTFKFIPPLESFYVVKPIQGIITGSHQIIVVQLMPMLATESPYMERWTLQLNGCNEYEVYLLFRGFAENPCISIGDDDCVHFPSTYPNSRVDTLVPMRNLTRYKLRYSLQVPIDDQLNIFVLPQSGVIEPNQIVYIMWSYRPVCEGTFSQVVKVEVSYGSKTLDFPIPITCTVVQASLLAVPDMIDVGSLRYGDSNTDEIKIENNGKCRAIFMLKCVCPSMLESKVCKDVQLHPSSGDLQSGGSMMVRVNIRPSDIGIHEFFICYIMMNKVSSMRQASSLVPIFTLKYFVTYPQLKVKDIQCSEFSHHSSKFVLWKMLGINRLNKMQRTFPPKLYEAVHMMFPDNEEGSPPFVYYMVIQNASELPVSWLLQQCFDCDCPTVADNSHISLRKKIQLCNHRGLFTCEPSSGELEPFEEQLLTCRVFYKAAGEYSLSMTLKVHKHTMKLIGHFTTNKSKGNDLAIEGLYLTERIFPEVNFRSTYIGELRPVCQLLWICNNSSSPATEAYEIDTGPLEELRKRNFDQQIISCLNPKGAIAPKKLHAVAFLFHPVEMNTYQATVPIRFGNRIQEILIQGDGICNTKDHTPALREKTPDQNLTLVPSIPVVLSASQLIIKTLSIHSKAHRVVFVKNVSNDTYRFLWKSIYVNDLLKISMIPDGGVLKAGEFVACRIAIESYCFPSVVQCKVQCYIYNISAEDVYQNNVRIIEEIKIRRQEEFIIIEGGLQIPEPVGDYKHYGLKEPEFQTASLMVSTCIVDSVHIDEKIKWKNQLLSFPTERMYLRTMPDALLNKEEGKICGDIFEKILWDTLHDNAFRHIVQKVSDEQTPYYTQYIVNEKHRDERATAILQVPPHTLIAMILNELILEALAEALHFPCLFK